ncbi:MAG: hypothetical protein HZC54_00625 [Verrucomicrobia bacterium]|nr:hypothetical protein [Verrucomicrobiota bacterium]
MNEIKSPRWPKWALIGSLSTLALLAAFWLGRWTSSPTPVPSAHYVTTYIPNSVQALVTETHSGRVQMIQLKDLAIGKVWSPPAR